MKIEYLSYLIDVVESGSLSFAAKKSYITQSSLSKIIQNMEEELGFRLLNRTNSGVVPTAECKEMMEEVKDVVSKYRSWKQIPNRRTTNTLKVLSTPAINHIIISPAIFSFHKIYPSVQINNESILNYSQRGITEDSMASMLKKFPIVIMTSFQQPLHMKTEKFHTELLFRDVSCVYGNTNQSFMKRHDSCVLQDLPTLPVITCQDCIVASSSYSSTLFEAIRTSDLVFNSMMDVFSAVHNNDGVAILTGLYMFSPYYYMYDDFKIIPITDYTTYYYLFTAPSLTPHEEKFVELLKTSCADFSNKLRKAFPQL